MFVQLQIPIRPMSVYWWVAMVTTTPLWWTTCWRRWGLLTLTRHQWWEDYKGKHVNIRDLSEFEDCIVSNRLLIFINLYLLISVNLKMTILSKAAVTSLIVMGIVRILLILLLVLVLLFMALFVCLTVLFHDKIIAFWKKNTFRIGLEFNVLNVTLSLEQQQ